MRHLTRDDLVDLAEGVRQESAASHLDSCDKCRRDLADLRGAITAAAAVDVPEPSPLFWDHFSARVHAAIASEGAPGQRRWLDRWSWPGMTAPLTVAALILIAAVVTVRVARAPGRLPAPASMNAVVDTLDDPSLDLVADLSGDFDWETAGEGLSIREGTADKALTQLTEGERVELRRLLEQELRQAGD